MKKLLGIVTAAALALSALFAVPAGAAEVLDGVWIGTEGFESYIEQKDDGTIAVKGWNSVDNVGANYGISLKDKSVLEGDFTLELKAKVPNDFAGTTIGLFGNETGDWSHSAFSLKIVNYTNHPTVSNLEVGYEAFTNSGSGVVPGPCAYNGVAGLTSSDWNTVKMEVAGNKVTVTINGQAVMSAFEFARPESGNLVLGINGNKADGTEFKDIKITKGGEVVFTTVPDGSDTGSSDTDSGVSSETGSSNPDTSDAMTFAAFTMAAAGAVLVAVCAVRARKLSK